MKRLTIILITLAVAAAACSSGNVFSLEVGQCFNDPEAFGEISDVEIVDCTEAHDNEVYHVFDIAGDDYPGDAAVQTAADQGCLDAFAPYVGIDYDDSAWIYSALRPTEDSWDRGDDREVVCFLFDISFEAQTGSARNSNR